MSFSIDDLREHSNLPGPRANLELLYKFIEFASVEEVEACLQVKSSNLQNTPDEFVLACGVAAGIYMSMDKSHLFSFDFIPYANHESWRVRESVCIGFQKSIYNVASEKITRALEPLRSGTALELRTYIATVAEPALLNGYMDTNLILDDLYNITLSNFKHDLKLSESEKVLRKALGYCWSVVLCGKDANRGMFEQLMLEKKNKHISWIINENLKKNRLMKLDPVWVEQLKLQL
ncbi:MAG: hypothetical protein BGO41_14930 [Clostridiales bacterium 38-18]|nr:MAG: hypothetical protein BGO41_14930 [Clostridiales bacterium 38-18]